jgi:hypothetical protein
VTDDRLGFKEELAMGRTAKSAQGDRAGERDARIAKAKQRRLELDKDKEARDARIDQPVADVYLAQDERDGAVKVIEFAEAKMGQAIVRILAEGVPMGQVAELTGLSVNQMQNLKAVTVEAAETPSGAAKAAGRSDSASQPAGARSDAAGASGSSPTPGQSGVRVVGALSAASGRGEVSEAGRMLGV